MVRSNGQLGQNIKFEVIKIGRFGFHSGYLQAQNIQAGDAQFAHSQSKSKSVSFTDNFKATPSVIITEMPLDKGGGTTLDATTYSLILSTKSSTGFTATGSIQYTTSIGPDKFSWVAIDDTDRA